MILVEIKKNIANTSPSNSSQILNDLIKNEQIESVTDLRYFLSKYPNTNINEPDEKGYTPLIYAAAEKNDNTEIVHELLNLGGNCNHISKDKQQSTKSFTSTAIK